MAYYVAIMNTGRPLHLEIQRHRKNYYGLIRSSYRQGGKVKHTTHGRLTGMSLEQLRLIQAAFRQDVVPTGTEGSLQVVASREYGASRAILALARELGLDRMLYSRREPWVEHVLAMVASRLIYADSKLSLSYQEKKLDALGAVWGGGTGRC